MKKIFLFLIVLLTILSQMAIKKRVVAAGSPLQISTFHDNQNEPCGVFYSPPPYTFTYNGGTVWLSSLSDGTGNIYTDDKVDIEVTRPDGTKFTYSYNYGVNGMYIAPTAPVNATSWFKTGNNSVKITMTGLHAPYCNSSQYWLVEIVAGGGGDTSAPKPEIKPRSSWLGDNSGIIDQQTPNHIVIHHARSTNDPGNLGTYFRELNVALYIDPTFAKSNIFSPQNIVAKKNSQYPTIRNSWEGQIFLIWAEHKFGERFDDIGYNYIVAPNGNIYEGRWKGTLAENAENRGQAVRSANTGAVHISVLGRYGSDGGYDQAVSKLDAGIAEPTDASIQSVKKMVDWIAGKYSISPNGVYNLPRTVNNQQSCKKDDGQPGDVECNVSAVAAHRDYPPLTLTDSTVCPGDNLYKFLPTFRTAANLIGIGTPPAHTNASGIAVAGWSPVKLGVVDPAGKRLGIDPATGMEVANIQGGVYGKIELFDTEGEDEDKPYILHIPTGVNGVYQIDVVGTDAGTFTITSGDLGTTMTRAMGGSTTAGVKDKYQIIYNTANPGAIELFHDTVPPVTTGTMTCSRDMLGICRSDVVFTLAATDKGTGNDSGSGVAKIECSYDNKATWNQCGSAAGGSVVFNKNGTQSFWYRSIDRVGNVESAKHSGNVNVQKFIAIANTLLKANMATKVETTGIAQTNGNASFTYNTKIALDVLDYIGTFSQSGNSSFTVNKLTKVTTPAAIPLYPLSFYKSQCQNVTGSLTIQDTSPVYNKCLYVIGDVTFRSTTPSGKLTLVAEGFINDQSTYSNFQAWDTKNGILFYSAKGVIISGNRQQYKGVLYTPTADIKGVPSNYQIDGSLYAKNVDFGTGTSLTARQAAGFPPTTYNLPL